MTNDFPPLPDTPALSQAVADVRTGNPEAAVLRRQVERLERELADWEQLVADSAPLAWAASGDMNAASEWEKRAADMLARSAKLLTVASTETIGRARDRE